MIRRDELKYNLLYFFGQGLNGRNPLECKPSVLHEKDKVCRWSGTSPYRVAPSNLFEGDEERFYFVLSGSEPNSSSSNQASGVAPDTTGKILSL